MNKILHLKTKVYETIEDNIVDSRAHKIFESIMISLVLANVAAVIIESFINDLRIFRGFEVFSVLVFSIEFALRLWVADLKYESSGFMKPALKQIFSPPGLIDIVSILPFYLSLFFPIGFDARILRLLRLTRLLRLFKLRHYLDSFRLIEKVIQKKRYELFITAFLVFLLLLVSSTLMYEVEHDAQPDKFPNIVSALWWAVATLTTIGYGDVYPITNMGRFISAAISLIGIGLVALPTGIISSGFIEEFRSNDPHQIENDSCTFCPHCGKKIKD